MWYGTCYKGEAGSMSSLYPYYNDDDDGGNMRLMMQWLL